MAVAAAGILLRDKRILLVLRGEYTDAFPGFWACPAGRAEGDESPEEAVRREVLEEVGLDFRPTRLFMQTLWKDRDLFRYLGEWEGTPSLQEEELADMGWFDYETASSLPLAFDYDDVIKKLHAEGLL